MVRRRALLAGVALAATAAVVTPASVTSVSADTTPIVIDLSSGDGAVQLTLDAIGDFRTSTLPVTPAPGCTPIGPVVVGSTTGGTICMGAPVAGAIPELEMYSPPGSGFVAGGPEAMAALGWIVEEGIEAIRAMYGVPHDARIQRYAAAEIRAYVFTRILDILDKYAYGHTLTAEEHATFTFVEESVLAIDREVTTAAYEEYQHWQQSGCAYVPPPAPAFVADPVGLPDDVRRWCTRAHNLYDQLFVFAPPQPTAEHFQAWGAYRNTQELGLDALDEAEAQAMLVDTISAGAVLGGVAVAIGAAAITSALVGSSAALAGAVAGAMGASAATGAAMTAFGPAVVGAMISGTAAMAAASVVAIVILAVVVTAVAIVQLVEHAKVGETIVARMNQAAEASDPFGLDALRALGADRPLRGDLDPGNLPAYRGQENAARLAQLVTTWLTVTPSGVLVPDATGVWADNATTTRDFRFEVTDDAGTRVVDAITVPAGDGAFQEVRFSDSWMIVTPQGGQPTATLSFRFRDVAGTDLFAARSAGPSGGWVLTRASSAGSGFQGARAAFIRFVDENGQQVTARIEPPQVELAGPHPTVVGPLVPGRVVNLRPNPVGADGSFDLARYTNDFSYRWQLDRFDPDSGTWQPVALETPNAYGTRFTPDEVGQYRAMVTMSDLDDPAADDVTGLVQFRITSPEIVVDTLQLTDDGRDSLGLELRLSEPVASDTFTVEVQWPAELGTGVRATSTETIACSTLGIDCESGPIVREYLTHTLSPTAELSTGVIVTIRNSYGSVLSRTFDLAHPDRPVIVEPFRTPSAEQLGTVRFGQTGAAVQLVAETDASTNTNYMIAAVEPGDGDPDASFSFVQPGGQRPTTIFPLGPDSLQVSVYRDGGTDRWAIGLWGAPRLDQVGSYEFPLVVQQGVTGGVSGIMVRLEIAASPEDRYRGVLVSSLDPRLTEVVPSVPVLQPQIIGGRVGWQDYTGEVCVSLREVSLPTPPAVRCGPAAEFFDADGAPAPFPYESLMPGGVPATTLLARLWLADEDDASAPAFAGAHEVRFLLESAPPRITTLDWDAAAGAALLALEPSAPSAPITVVDCELDGAPAGCWGVAGGSWQPAGLAPGSHTVLVHVRDAARNFTTRQLSFTVPQPGEPGTGTPGTGGPDSDGPDAERPGSGVAPTPGDEATSPGELPEGEPGSAPDDAEVDDAEVGGTGDAPEPQSAPGAAELGTGAGDTSAGAVVWVLLGLALAILLALAGVFVVRARRAGRAA